MAIHEEPPILQQGAYISGPTYRNFEFAGFTHVISAAEAGYFEWWFPEADDDGRHHIIHYSTLHMDKAPLPIGSVQCFLQNGDNTEQRVLLCKLDTIKGWQQTPEFFAQHGYRGLVVIEKGLEGTILKVRFIVERA